MYPILYESITPGVVPSHFGLGTLTDCLSCTVQEARNGVYELELVYPASGIHLNDLQPRRVLKAKPNFTDDPQLFRIYKVGKVMQGKVTVYAKHISYDLSGYIIQSGSANNCISACAVLENAATGFTITTDKTVSANWEVKYPSSVRSWLGGKEGSLLDVYGTGEYKYNNFEVNFLLHRGANRGVTIRYGKNLTELSQELNSENLVTGVIAYYKDSEDVITKAPKVSTGLVLDCTKDYALDCSSDFDETPTVQELTAKATSYIQNHILTNIVSNITLNFAQTSQLVKDRVDLCDTVSIYLEALGISTTVQCIQTKWDVLEEKYTQIEFGDPKTNFADTIISIGNTADEAVTPNKMNEAINNATSKITGNQGGYVVFHDTNADKKPDEILVLDNLDIDQAVKVWRWNVAGLGYSGTGYNGQYRIALTNDGKIVADMITTGTMSANRVRTGVLSDELGKNSINLDTGEATFTSLKVKINNTNYDIGTDGIRTAFAADDTAVTVNSGAITFNSDTFVVNSTNLEVTSTGLVTATGFKAKESLRLLDSNNVVRTKIGYNSVDGSTLDIYDNNGKRVLTSQVNPSGNGAYYVLDSSEKTTGVFQNTQYGGALYVYNANNKSSCGIFSRPDGEGGQVRVYSSSGDTRGYFTSTNAGSELGLYDSNGTLQSYLNQTGLYLKAGQVYVYNNNHLRTYLNHNGLYLNDDNNNLQAYLTQSGLFVNAGQVRVNNALGDQRCKLWVSTTGGGVLNLADNSDIETITCGGDSGWVTCVHVNETSSRKVKENIKPIEDAEKILKLEAVSFDFKDKAWGTDQRGFIAEDVAKVLPNLVVPESENRPASLNYTGMIPYLQEVIKNQEARITALEAKIDELTKENANE